MQNRLNRLKGKLKGYLKTHRKKEKKIGKGKELNRNEMKYCELRSAAKISGLELEKYS